MRGVRMKLIIDIPEEDYKHGMLGLYFDCYSMKLHETILNGTPIPDNATNGDVIKAFYPDAKYDTYFDFIAMTTHTERTVFMSRFDRDWWNAPYQKGGANEKQV